MATNVYTELAEGMIEIYNETMNFDYWLSFKLVQRSKELVIAATCDQLLTEVCEDMVQAKFGELIQYRTKKHGACHMTVNEAPKIAEALKPLCSRAFVKLNALLSIDREILFRPRDYIVVVGNRYYEEAPGVTFVRFLNDMQRLKGFGSETYERDLPRIAEVYALNRVANVMPLHFHKGRSGKLAPLETIEDRLRAERQAAWQANGITCRTDLIAEFEALQEGAVSPRTKTLTQALPDDTTA